MQVTAKPAGDRGEDYVVDGSAQRVLDRLDVAEPDADPGEAPVRSDLAVVGGGGGGAEGAARKRAHATDGVERVARELARPAEGVADRADDLPWLGGTLEQRVGEQLRARRHGSRLPRLHRGWRWRRVGCQIEENGHDIRAGDAVDKRVVGV